MHFIVYNIVYKMINKLMLLLQAIALLNYTYGYIEMQNLAVFKGIKIVRKTSNVIDKHFSPSALKCIMNCHRILPCQAVHYNSDNKQCEILYNNVYATDVTLMEVDPTWRTIQLDKGYSWRLLFRAGKGINYSVYDSWTNEDVASDNDMRCRLIQNTACLGIYKNPLLYTWTPVAMKYLHITDTSTITDHASDPTASTISDSTIDSSTTTHTQIKIVLYKDGSEVQFLLFDFVGADIYTVFQQLRLINSSWSTLSTRSLSVFSLYGEVSATASRRFFISEFMSTCDTDNIFMVVIDKIIPDGNCLMDRSSTIPSFLYAPGQASVVFDGYNNGEADVFAVFGKS